MSYESSLLISFHVGTVRIRTWTVDAYGAPCLRVVCSYLLVALCMTSLYSLLTAASSVKSMSSSASCAKGIFILILLDVVSILYMNYYLE